MCLSICILDDGVAIMWIDYVLALLFKSLGLKMDSWIAMYLVLCLPICILEMDAGLLLCGLIISLPFLLSEL